MSTKKTALFVDGNALMHRSFHAFSGTRFNPTYEGQSVGMVYGMGAALLQSLNAFTPEILAFGFDTKEKTFRHEMDEAYKAQRQKAPDGFYEQVPLVYELLEAFDIPILKMPGFEADDIVGTLAVSYADQDYESIILSNDMDYTQLLSEKIKLCRPQGEITPEKIVAQADVESKYGIRIDQMVDFKAITGDSSDNYKGIDGIGPKGAANLLNEYETLENIYANLGHLPEKIRLKCEDQKDYVFHCQALAKIKTDVDFPPLPNGWDIDMGGGEIFLEKLGFRSLAKRASKMNTNTDQEKNKELLNSSKKTEEEEQMSLF